MNDNQKESVFDDAGDARLLAQAIVDTIREPLLVLDNDLCVVVASRSFYRQFKMARQDVQGQPFHSLSAGLWNIPALRSLLEKIVPDHEVMDDFEVEHEFPALGRRTMLLNARKVFFAQGNRTLILLSFDDITDRRVVEREAAELSRQKGMLLEEVQHRVANSLQIIASILLMKARSVKSEETRLHLYDAHDRVLSVAAVQQHLHPSKVGEEIDLNAYLTRLCETLASSMIDSTRQVTLTVGQAIGSASSSRAVSMGLVVTELVINALKHAFPVERPSGEIVVSYEMTGANWRLAVSDNGIGKLASAKGNGKAGLGTSIVEALARQLDGKVAIASDPTGTTVSIARSQL